MPKTEKPAPVRYLGDGTQFVLGVPSRDMAPDEWAALPAERRAYALACGLYDAPAEQPPAPED